jgi:ABC-type transport system involved in multi-copper enzyme maturation permease subunit
MTAVIGTSSETLSSAFMTRDAAHWRALMTFRTIRRGLGPAVLLGAIFLSIAAAIASATDKRVTALGVGIFAWFAFVLLYDGAALSLAGWLTGSVGGRVLFASAFGNPVDVVRIAMLLVSGTPHVLRAAGDAWMRFLGGNLHAAVMAAAALMLWTVVPLASAIRVMRLRDL